MARLTALADHLEANPAYGAMSAEEVAADLNTPSIPCFVDIDTAEIRSYWIEQGMMDDLVSMLSAQPGDPDDPIQVAQAKQIRNLGYACQSIYNAKLGTVRCTDEVKRTAFYEIADACLALGVCTAEQCAAVKAMGDGLMSWAQANHIGSLTARDVIQARLGNLNFGG